MHVGTSPLTTALQTRVPACRLRPAPEVIASVLTIVSATEIVTLLVMRTPSVITSFTTATLRIDAGIITSVLS